MNPNVEKAIEKFQKLPAAGKAGILGGVLVVIFISYYFLLFNPTNKELDVIEGRIRVLQAEINKKKIIADNLSTYKQEVEKLKADLDKAFTKLPNEAELEKLLVDIPNLGKESGIEITKFKPKKEGIKQFFAEIPIELVMTGAYHDIGVFLFKVSQLPRIVNIGNLDIKPGKAATKSKDGPEAEEESPIVEVKGIALIYRFVETASVDASAKNKRPGR